MNLVQNGLSVKIIPVQYIGNWHLRWYVLLISSQSLMLNVHNVSVIYTLTQ